jgi:hypothetical protein
MTVGEFMKNNSSWTSCYGYIQGRGLNGGVNGSRRVHGDFGAARKLDELLWMDKKRITRLGRTAMDRFKVGD